MTIDLKPGVGENERGLDLAFPKIYRPEDICSVEYEMRVRVKEREFTTNAVLPVGLNGRIHYLPIIPVVDKEGKEIGIHICWLDPHPDRNRQLADDGAVELSKLLIGLPQEKTFVYSPPTGKSEYMTKLAVKLASKSRGFTEVIFKEALSEGDKHAKDGSPLAYAERYFPVTAQEIGKVMGVSPEQAALIESAAVDSHVNLDDVISLRRTTQKMAEMIQKISLAGGKIVKLDDIPTVALAIEVQDTVLRAAYAPRRNEFAPIVIPEMTTPIVRISSGEELDLRELAHLVS